MATAAAVLLATAELNAAIHHAAVMGVVLSKLPVLHQLATSVAASSTIAISTVAVSSTGAGTVAPIVVVSSTGPGASTAATTAATTVALSGTTVAVGVVVGLFVTVFLPHYILWKISKKKKRKRAKIALIQKAEALIEALKQEKIDEEQAAKMKAEQMAAEVELKRVAKEEAEQFAKKEAEEEAIRIEEIKVNAKAVLLRAQQQEEHLSTGQLEGIYDSNDDFLKVKKDLAAKQTKRARQILQELKTQAQQGQRLRQHEVERRQWQFKVEQELLEKEVEQERIQQETEGEHRRRKTAKELEKLKKLECEWNNAIALLSINYHERKADRDYWQHIRAGLQAGTRTFLSSGFSEGFSRWTILSGVTSGTVIYGFSKAMTPDYLSVRPTILAHLTAKASRFTLEACLASVLGAPSLIPIRLAFLQLQFVLPYCILKEDVTEMEQQNIVNNSSEEELSLPGPIGPPPRPDPEDDDKDSESTKDSRAKCTKCNFVRETNKNKLSSIFKRRLPHVTPTLIGKAIHELKGQIIFAVGGTKNPDLVINVTEVCRNKVCTFGDVRVYNAGKEIIGNLVWELGELF
eukprot:m.44727 g.44727  ORF g.44727 m.44727 type:complete len:576 (-) comp19761_c0_seq1:179-1906(-)